MVNRAELHAVWTFDFAKLKLEIHLVRTDLRNDQEDKKMFDRYFSPLTVIAHSKVSKIAAKSAKLNNSRIFAVLFTGIKHAHGLSNQANITVKKERESAKKCAERSIISNPYYQSHNPLSSHIFDITEKCIDLLGKN